MPLHNDGDKVTTDELLADVVQVALYAVGNMAERVGSGVCQQRPLLVEMWRKYQLERRLEVYLARAS